MDFIERVNGLIESGQMFCFATIIASIDRGIPPGLKAIVLGDGSLEGGIDPPELRGSLIATARKCLQTGKSETVEISVGVKAFFDVLSGEARLLICGAGHIALPLARFAREVGFRVTVLDDRPEFSLSSRFPGCEVIAEDFTEALQKVPINASTYVVVITRGHEHDTDCLREILPKKTAYVGLIGSRRRIRFVLELLVREGVSENRLRDIFTPVGLPIGADSPEEIALSIIAELVCIRRNGVRKTRALRTVAVD